MKIRDWEIAGQLLAAITEVQLFCRECCSVLGTGPQILVWLNTLRGKEVLAAAVQQVIATWKMEYEIQSRTNRINIGSDSFETLRRACRFEGTSVRESMFPSQLTSIGQEIEFKEVASGSPLKKGEELTFLASQGLRAAEPLEFLTWLRANQQAGLLTSIYCTTQSTEGNYMHVCLCGGGGRGLHTNRPHNDIWQPATVFLGVKLN